MLRSYLGPLAFLALTLAPGTRQEAAPASVGDEAAPGIRVGARFRTLHARGTELVRSEDSFVVKEVRGRWARVVRERSDLPLSAGEGPQATLIAAVRALRKKQLAQAVDLADRARSRAPADALAEEVWRAALELQRDSEMRAYFDGLRDRYVGTLLEQLAREAVELPAAGLALAGSGPCIFNHDVRDIVRRPEGRLGLRLSDDGVDQSLPDDARFEVEEVAELVRKNIAPETWEKGGTYLEAGEGFVTIVNTPVVQELVRGSWTICGLPFVRGRLPRSGAASPPHVGYTRALERRST